MFYFPENNLCGNLWFVHDGSSCWSGGNNPTKCSYLPTQGVPCSYWSHIDLHMLPFLVTFHSFLRVRMWQILSAKRTPGTSSQEMEVFLQLRWHCPRGVCIPKKWMSIFTFIEWVSPIPSHSVLHLTPVLMCLCAKKNGLSRFTMRNRFPLSKGTSLPQCHCDQYKMGRVSQLCLFFWPVHIEPSAFTRGSFPPSALSRDLVWQPPSGVRP